MSCTGGDVRAYYYTVEGPHAGPGSEWPRRLPDLEAPADPRRRARARAFFPRADYAVTLHVQSAAGEWTQVSRTIDVELPPALVEIGGELRPAGGPGEVQDEPSTAAAEGTCEASVLYLLEQGEYRAMRQAAAAPACLFGDGFEDGLGAWSRVVPPAG